MNNQEMIYQIESYIESNEDFLVNLSGTAKRIVVSHIEDVKSSLRNATNGYVCEDDLRNLYNSIIEVA